MWEVNAKGEYKFMSQKTDEKQIQEAATAIAEAAAKNKYESFVKSIEEKINTGVRSIDDRLAKALEQLTSKEDLAPFMNMTAREIYMSQKKRSLIEKMNAFRDTDAGKMTVKELLTSTSAVALPTMVQSQAVLELTGNWVDARELCMLVDVPKGSGITINTNLITMPAFDSWTEGSALAAADPTVATKTITLAPFGKVTLISDLLANTSALNFVEQVGRIHGACVRQGMFSKILTVISAAAGLTVSAAATPVLTFADVRNAIKKIANAGVSSPDFIVTSPTNAWTAFGTTDAMTQYYGALAPMMMNGLGKGPVKNVLGLDWYIDPYWDTLYPAATKKLAYVGCKAISSIWGALQTEPQVEIYRLPTALANYIITHVDGGASVGSPNSISTITYAS